MAGCTERKGLVQVLARKIKVKRRLIAENIMLGVAAELAHPVGEVDDRTVRNDDSLRRTGRTRGEQQVNRVNIQYALTDGLQQVCVSRCCKALVHRDERGTVGKRLGLLTVALGVGAFPLGGPACLLQWRGHLPFLRPGSRLANLLLPSKG